MRDRQRRRRAPSRTIVNYRFDGDAGDAGYSSLGLRAGVRLVRGLWVIFRRKSEIKRGANGIQTERNGSFRGTSTTVHFDTCAHDKKIDLNCALTLLFVTRPSRFASSASKSANTFEEHVAAIHEVRWTSAGFNNSGSDGRREVDRADASKAASDAYCEAYTSLTGEAASAGLAASRSSR